MARTSLPDGATAVRVGTNGEHIIVSPANAYRPPAAEFIRGGRKTRLIPADRIEQWARENTASWQYDSLCDLLDKLSGAPRFSSPIQRRRTE